MDEQAPIWPSWARSDSGNGRNETEGSATTIICEIALELRRLVARDVLTIANPSKTFYCLLIPITSRGRPVFRVVSFHDLLCQDWVFCNTSVKDQRTSELSFAESKCADTSTNDSGILQRSLRSVEPVCFAASHRALSHMKPRGSLAATVLTESKTPLESSAALEILHQANRGGIFAFRAGVIFQF